MDDTTTEAPRPIVELALGISPPVGATRWIDVTPLMAATLQPGTPLR
jgi:hypothetical protein